MRNTMNAPAQSSACRLNRPLGVLHWAVVESYTHPVLRKIIHTVIVVAAVMQITSCIFGGAATMPDASLRRQSGNPVLLSVDLPHPGAFLVG